MVKIGKYEMTPGVLGERLGEAIIKNYVPKDVLQNLERVIKKALNGYPTDLEIVVRNVGEYISKNVKALYDSLGL